MLYLDIQRAKEAMNTEVFQNHIGGTSACMKRIMMTAKGWGELTSNSTYFLIALSVELKDPGMQLHME